MVSRGKGAFTSQRLVRTCRSEEEGWSWGTLRGKTGYEVGAQCEELGTLWWWTLPGTSNHKDMIRRSLNFLAEGRMSKSRLTNYKRMQEAGSEAMGTTRGADVSLLQERLQ